MTTHSAPRGNRPIADSLRRLAIALLLVIAAFPIPGTARAAEPYQTGFHAWRAEDRGFAAWQRAGLEISPGGALRLHSTGGVARADGVLFGEAISTIQPTTFGFLEAIGSWNAATPAGSWTETLVRVRSDRRWSGWYSLGLWASDPATLPRQSMRGQADANASLDVDTLKLRQPADAFQMKVQLFARGAVQPEVRSAALAFSTRPVRPSGQAASDRLAWGTELKVPMCSQMVYSDGGRVWCSPTSTAMILGYWQGWRGPCEPPVRAAVAGVYDVAFRGHGNWSFNAAYAADQGFEAYVARLTSLADAASWIAAGAPLAISFAFGPGELAGAPLRSVNGHLSVLVGFDARGNPIVHDPAAPTNGSVRRVYDRAALERIWLEHSGGTVYVIHPVRQAMPSLAGFGGGAPTPANDPGPPVSRWAMAAPVPA